MNQKSTASSRVAVAYPLDRAQDVILSKEELAARLNVAVRTIENWQQKHYLPTIKVEHLVMLYWPTMVLHLHTHFSLSPPQIQHFAVTSQDLSFIGMGFHPRGPMTSGEKPVKCAGHGNQKP